jgi:TM2 domain-containing membrane protein YozV
MGGERGKMSFIFHLKKINLKGVGTWVYLFYFRFCNILLFKFKKFYVGEKGWGKIFFYFCLLKISHLFNL